MNLSTMTANPIGSLPDAPPTDVAADTALVAAARSGDRAGRAALLDALQDPIYRFCVASLGDADSAMDATQETALRLLRTLGRYKGRSSLRTWALGIALNVCREMRRSKARNRTADVPAMLTDERTVGPADRASDAEQRSRVIALLDELSDRHREAIVLRYLEGLTVQETAEAMGLAPGTVKATTFAALRRLRSKMDEPI